ncbi:hypothetical protein HJC23_004429 [Cyclotella cryptica]|uniref:Uncharacterized protein n=1 Tax=Cyclotella cryptica TaxID=29204 RepID=A0ABD3QE62_9STRA|eukprot:CCRYP_006038-RA/>CCRYP_006038-RA protein AED:0.33 eAED:0.33 QI:434/1/1/1/0/0/2/129/210
MCFVYESPLCSTSNSNQALQCPPTPRKYRFVQSGLSFNDPVFFPSSSSVIGSNACVADSSSDDETTEERLLERINRFPAMVLLLKPQNKACRREAHVTKRKLTISDVMGEIPPLPFAVSQHEQGSIGRSSSDPEQNSASKRNAIAPSTIDVISFPELPPICRSSSDPEHFSASKKNASAVSSSKEKSPSIRRTISNFPGSRRRSLNAKCA